MVDPPTPGGLRRASFVRSAATEKLVRPLGVEPLGVDVELGLHHVDVKRRDKSAGEFVLEIAVEPFDDRDAPVLADGTVAVSDVRKEECQS